MMDVWGRQAEPSGARSADPAAGNSENLSATAKAQVQEEDMCFVYPVLQPRVRRRRGNSGGLPWSGEDSRTFLRFSVFFANPFNR